MNDQGRILGIDFGTKRIGLSISDPLRILATSYGAIGNTPDVWKELAEIIRGEGIVFIVVGMPLNLKGEEGEKARQVRLFIDELGNRFQIEVVPWDERFTTSLAQRSMRHMGTTQKQRRTAKGRIDAMAAAIMLQGFLDSTKKSMSC